MKLIFSDSPTSIYINVALLYIAAKVGDRHISQGEFEAKDGHDVKQEQGVYI